MLEHRSRSAHIQRLFYSSDQAPIFRSAKQGAAKLGDGGAQA